MMRGWMIAAALVSCTAHSLSAQQAAPNRYARQPAAARYRYDRQVTPAAAANSRPPRSSRQSAQGGSRSGGKPSAVSSFFSRFKLPSFGSNRNEGRQPDVSDAPLPYDPAELEQDMNAVARGHQRPSTMSSRRTAPSPQASSAARPAVQRPSIPQAAPPVPRVTRNSPVPSQRRNELAEALAGLTPEASADEPQEQVAIDQPAASGIAPPVASEADDLPGYLQDSAAVARRETAAASPSLDVGEALMDEAPSRATASSVASRPVYADSVEETTPAPRRSPAVSARRDIADAFRTRSAAPPEPVAADDEYQSYAATERAPERPAAPAARNSVRTGRVAGNDILFTAQQPVIASFIEGPQSIVVGRQAEYRVTVENQGAVAAREVVGTIVAPAGAELVEASVSQGAVDRAEADPTGASSELNWRLIELAPGAKQTLTLQLIPRGGREMQLGVQWNHAPVSGQAIVEIQEPKIQMEIAGPADVLYGKSQRYALTLSNPGNGPAEEVTLELTPPGADQSGVVRHKVGALAAGETKKIELELTAREAGDLRIQAVATALGGLRTETVKNVLCRKAELEIDWRGPDQKFAGATATYFIRVRNPGTAAAEQVAVEISLPPGAELLEASEGHAWNADRRTVVWQGATLNPGDERFMEIQCRMSQPGVNKMELTAHAAAGDLSDAKSAAVNVEALADLKLEVVDPKGVIPVGDMAVYEVRIKNRGQTAAKGVNVVAMFSDGIEPSHVEGGQNAINDGRVAFRTIDSLAAGSEIILKIHAKASLPGTHVFRAEVACDELDVKLAAEETTRFFNDEQRWADASTAYADEEKTTTR